MARPTQAAFGFLAILLTCGAHARPAHAAWSPSGLQLDTWTSYGYSNFHAWRDPSLGLQMAWWRLNNQPSTSIQRVSEAGAFPFGWGVPANGLWNPATSQPNSVPDGSGGMLHAVSAFDAGNTVYFFSNSSNGALTLMTSAASAGTNAFDGNVARAASGSAFVTWNQLSGGFQLRARRLNNDGSPVAGWPAAGIVIAPSTAEVYTVTDDGGGGLIAVWGTVEGTLRAQRITGTGTVSGGWPTDGLELAPGITETKDSDLRLIRSGANGWIIVWKTFGQSAVRLLRFQGDGTVDPAWPSNGLTVIDTPASVSSIATILDGQDGAWIGWNESGAPWIRHVTAAGAFAVGFESGPLPLLDAGAQYGGSFAIVRGLNGGLLYAWNDARPTAPGLRVGWRLANGSPDPALADTGRVVIAGPANAASPLGLIEDASGGGYLAWVHDTGANTQELFMNRVLVTPPPPTSVDEDMQAGSRLSLSPNPASRWFTVHFVLSGPELSRLELLDLAGRRVASRDVAGAGEHFERFDNLGALPPGVYLVRLAHGAYTSVARVALVR